MADSAAELRRVRLEPEDDEGDSSNGGYDSSDAESAPTEEDPDVDPEYEVDAIKWANYRDSRFDRQNGAKGWHYGVMWRGYLKTGSETEERLVSFLDSEGKAPMVKEFWEAVAKTNPSKKPGPRKLEPKGYIGEKIEVPKDLLKKWFKDIKKTRHKRDVATYFRRRQKEIELERRIALGQPTDDLRITKSDSDYYWNKKFRKERKKRRAQEAKEAQQRQAAEATSTTSTLPPAPAPVSAPIPTPASAPVNVPTPVSPEPATETIAIVPPAAVTKEKSGSPGIDPPPMDSLAPNSPASTLGSLFNSDQEDVDVDMVLDVSDEEQEQIEERPSAPSTSTLPSPSTVPPASIATKRKSPEPSPGDVIKVQPVPVEKKIKKVKKKVTEPAPVPPVEQNPVRKALNLIGLGKIPKRVTSPPPPTAATPPISFGALQPGIFETAPSASASQNLAIPSHPTPSPALSGSTSPAQTAPVPPRTAAPPDPRLTARATAIVQNLQGARSPLTVSSPTLPIVTGLPSKPSAPIQEVQSPQTSSSDGAPLPNFKPAPVLSTKLPIKKFEQPKRIQMIDNAADDEHSANKLKRLGIQLGPANLPARPTSSAFVPRGGLPPTGPRARNPDGNLSPNAAQSPGHMSPNALNNRYASPLMRIVSPTVAPQLPQYQASKDPRRKPAHPINITASATDAVSSLPTPVSASDTPLAHNLTLKPVDTTGGLVSFSPTLILRYPSRLNRMRKLILGNPDWGAYVLPAVVKFLNDSWGDKTLCPEPGASFPVLAAFLPFDEPLQSMSGLRPGGGLAISCCPPSPYDPACVAWKEWMHKLNTTSDYQTLSILCKEYLDTNVSKEAHLGSTSDLRAIEQMQLNDLKAMRGRSDIVSYTRRVFVKGDDESVDVVEGVEVLSADDFVMLIQSQAKL
ncbi:hypothetical protein I317_06620 [Kwoniella heveanensis CBS 569]|nr:hypothetical protein I317_06620 [Kwoniella heveanensis CBS 569]